MSADADRVRRLANSRGIAGARAVLRLIAESGGKVKLDSRHPNYLLIETGKIGLAEKSVYLREKLEKLSA
jgi:hypothetical protein